MRPVRLDRLGWLEEQPSMRGVKGAVGLGDGKLLLARARAGRPGAELGVRLVRVAFGGRHVYGDRDALRQLLDDSLEGGGELAGPVDDQRVPGRLLDVAASSASSGP